MKHKPSIYLAVPISGCNDAQKRKWRDEVKHKYGKSLNFIDPTDPTTFIVTGDSYEAVEADLRAIEEADGLLVNMWRESIGSAIGMVHAHREGRPVVVVNPNHLDSLILDFYADIVEETPLKAANAMLKLLRSTNWRVIKSGDREDEAFDRRKLVASIRKACRAAKRNDLVVPRLAMQKILEHLEKSDRKLKKNLAAGDIDKAVMTSLGELEADPVYAEAVKGIKAEWQQRHKTRQRHPTIAGSEGRGTVEISCGKSHATIWGKTVKGLDDIPSTDARKVFQVIMDTSGITKITLGPFGRKGKKPDCGATIEASGTPNIIEGKLFDKGEKGTMQTFQVWVQHDSEKARVLNEIITKLKTESLWIE